MTTKIKNRVRRAMEKQDHPKLGIFFFGHRDYVGALWNTVGPLQFQFLVAQGLEPHHVLLDIACGSLRGGVHFVPFLDAGNYLGIDKERRLIRRGLRKELPGGVRRVKRPEFVVSRSFQFEHLSKKPDFALAHSLFTHLPTPLIIDCLTKLRSFAPQCRLFATFFESANTVTYAVTPCDTLEFRYTREEMAHFAREAGWEFHYIGPWGHPRGQVMTEFR